MATTDETDGPASDEPLTAPGVVPHRVLRRPTSGRRVSGVAAGLGRYLDLDPLLLRIGFVLLVVSGGSGIVLYLAGLVLIPEERRGDPVHTGPRPGGPYAAVVGGCVLVVLGAAALVGRVVPALGDLTGPVLLITVGLVLVLVALSRRAGGRR